MGAKKIKAKPSTTDAKALGHAVLSICVKCSDMYSHTIYKQDGTTTEYSGYVPSFFPDEHYGDYVMLDINPYTGKILNWRPWKRAKGKSK